MSGKTPRLLEVEATPRPKVTKALARIEKRGCPTCGGTLDPQTVTEDALLRHGGYGASRETVKLHCHECGWSVTASVTEVRPPKDAA